MKILFIAPKYTGGIGGHAAMLAEQLQKYGYEVTKMEVPHIPIKNLKNLSFAILGTLKGIFSQKKYDIVHAFNVPSAFAMKYANGKKKVLSIHGVYGEQVKTIHSKTVSSIVNSTENKVLKWADTLTTDSQYTKDWYKKLGFDFMVLPSAIDTQKFNQISLKQKKLKQIVYLGRDSYEKGIDILKETEPYVNGKIIYCTDLPWKKTMEILQSSTLMVIPSRIESLPTSIKESFYLKVPVIGTNVGGIPELISNNDTGILIPPNNSKVLGQTINELLNDEEKRKKLSDSAYEFVTKNLTWDVVLPKYIKFYENLLES